MASNQRRGYLDKSTRNHLSGIEAALAELLPKPRQEGEFSAFELWELAGGRSSGITMNSIRSKLQRSASNGDYEKRKVVINGKETNLYRKT